MYFVYKYIYLVSLDYKVKGKPGQAELLAVDYDTCPSLHSTATMRCATATNKQRKRVWNRRSASGLSWHLKCKGKIADLNIFKWCFSFVHKSGCLACSISSTLSFLARAPQLSVVASCVPVWKWNMQLRGEATDYAFDIILDDMLVHTHMLAHASQFIQPNTRILQVAAAQSMRARASISLNLVYKCLQWFILEHFTGDMLYASEMREWGDKGEYIKSDSTNFISLTTLWPCIIKPGGTLHPQHRTLKRCWEGTCYESLWTKLYEGTEGTLGFRISLFFFQLCYSPFLINSMWQWDAPNNDNGKAKTSRAERIEDKASIGRGLGDKDKPKSQRSSKYSRMFSKWGTGRLGKKQTYDCLAVVASKRAGWKKNKHDRGNKKNNSLILLHLASPVCKAQQFYCFQQYLWVKTHVSRLLRG